MRQYLSFFKIRFSAGLQYRAAAWAGIATQFFWGGLNILMYRAFYQSAAESFPMPMKKLSTYIWLQQACLAMFNAWSFDNETLESISNGNIAYELCRPCDLYSMWFAKNMATRLARVVLRCLPILLFAAFLPAPYGMRLPDSALAGGLFLLSLVLGFLITVAYIMLIYVLSFYTISPVGLRILNTSIVEFFSGAIIPIPFFPEFLQPILYALPFASMQNTPYMIYTGYISGTEIVRSVLLQILWLTVLTIAGRIWMRHAMKRVVVQGG